MPPCSDVRERLIYKINIGDDELAVKVRELMPDYWAKYGDRVVTK